MISTSGILLIAGQESSQQTPKLCHSERLYRKESAFSSRRSNSAQPYGLPIGQDATFGVNFAQPDTEDKKLRKDPYYLEVLALKVPFGTPLGKTLLLPE